LIAIKNRNDYKCPICGGGCYESNNDFACIDPDCEFAVGFNEYMTRTDYDNNIETKKDLLNQKIDRIWHDEVVALDNDSDFDWGKLFDLREIIKE